MSLPSPAIQLPSSPRAVNRPNTIQHHGGNSSSVALPLLEGLLAAPGEASLIIKRAFLEEKALDTVERALKQWVRKGRHGRKAGVRPNKRIRLSKCWQEDEDMNLSKQSFPLALPRLSSFDTLHHWWWKSLSSYVDAERCAAVRILIRAQSDSPQQHVLWLIRPLLLRLEDLVRRITSRPNGVASMGPPVSRRWIAEWVALLDHFLTPNMVLLAQIRWKLIQRIANHIMNLAMVLYQPQFSLTCLWTQLAAHDLLRGLLTLLQKWLLQYSNDRDHDMCFKNLHIWHSSSFNTMDTHGQPKLSISPLAALLTAYVAAMSGLGAPSVKNESFSNSLSSSPSVQNFVLSTLQSLVDPEFRRRPRPNKSTEVPSTATASASKTSTANATLASSNLTGLSAHAAAISRGMSLASVLERTTQLGAGLSPGSRPLPPPRLSEDEDEDEDDEEDIDGEDEDLILEEGDDHEDQAGTSRQQEEGEKLHPLPHPVESEEEPPGDRDEDEADEEELFIGSGHGDDDHMEEDDDNDEEEQLGNGSSEDDEDDDEDDDDDDDELEHDIDFHHPLLSSSVGEDRDRNRAVPSASGTGDVTAGNDNSRSVSATSAAVTNPDRPATTPLHPPLPERQEAFLRATMHVLARQYCSDTDPRELLTAEAEDLLLEGVNRVIKPPKKPITTKIIMRRAPTQEEFFRGNLSRNPISIDSLTASDGGEPTVGDLRQHIAVDLQMADSAGLIEILIANKIVDVNLKLRVVHQVLWRRHLMENTTTSSTSSGAGHSFLSMGSGFSMIFSHGLRSPGGGTGITADTPASHLPPMIAVYRLAGVDGEATEDTVTELVDPEAAAEASSSEERERLLEKEFGLTRIVLEHRGVQILLRSVQRCIADILRQIRRDDVSEDVTVENLARANFRKNPPCQALILMRHCTRLAANRKKLLQARAPTVLLSLVLDVLKGLEEPDSGKSNKAVDSAKSNQTAEMMQELIECLTSDIAEVGAGFETSDGVQDASSMPLLLESIETTSLGAPLRNVIAKLLPFLTYGQADLSQSLAQHFERHIILSLLTDKQDQAEERILMNTFVETAISLPANDVCNALRSELVACGFVVSLCAFILKDMPEQPPGWSAALWPKGQNAAKSHDAWRAYIGRDGVRTAFKILNGLCKQHSLTQATVCKYSRFVLASHWLEATSDSLDLMIDMKGLGLLAETLLDELVDGSPDVKKCVDAVRKKTRMRKKELAQERRYRTLGKMRSFGSIASAEESSERPLTGVSSLLGPVFCFFRDSNSGNVASPACSGKGKDSANMDEKPAWLAEMETIEEEKGLTCAICQEGRTSQPSELLGLYAFVRKVAISLEQCGSRASIDGSSLLKSLPSSTPAALAGKRAGDEWFPMGRAAGEDLSPTTSICMNSGSSRRSSVFTTTVSAGNGIHVSCHVRARQADRTHPKAPKSEWEGAKLRNGRVDCNIILPLVSSRSSKVALIAVDSALSEHQTAVSNLLGATPKSMLWTILYDVRFLLLRMAYGEPLNADCGGGSLASNLQLLLYEMMTADMFEKDAQVDQPEQSQHARGLSSGFLAACAILLSGDYSGCDQTSLTRGIADAAPMACLTCILFHNNYDDSGSGSEVTEYKPHPSRRWVVGRDYFIKGLLLCAGRRRALAIENSGCLPSRGNKKRLRPSSFANWDGEADGKDQNSSSVKPTLTDFQHSLRPMLTFFALMDQLSAIFTTSLEDSMIADAAETLSRTVEDSLRCKNIDELLLRTKITLDAGEIVDLVQKGIDATQKVQV